VARCTGHCCSRFHIDSRMLDRLTGPAEKSRDEKFILDMLVFLEWTDAGARLTCRHFDGTNCTRYEERPAMCRDYPYGKQCEFKGCTFSS
jgi:Fe-S-cluster containining protein